MDNKNDYLRKTVKKSKTKAQLRDILLSDQFTDYKDFMKQIDIDCKENKELAAIIGCEKNGARGWLKWNYHHIDTVCGQIVTESGERISTLVPISSKKNKRVFVCDGKGSIEDRTNVDNKSFVEYYVYNLSGRIRSFIDNYLDLIDKVEMTEDFEDALRELKKNSSELAESMEKKVRKPSSDLSRGVICEDKEEKIAATN